MLKVYHAASKSEYTFHIKNRKLRYKIGRKEILGDLLTVLQSVKKKLIIQLDYNMVGILFLF